MQMAVFPYTDKFSVQIWDKYKFHRVYRSTFHISFFVSRFLSSFTLHSSFIMGNWFYLGTQYRSLLIVFYFQLNKFCFVMYGKMFSNGLKVKFTYFGGGGVLKSTFISWTHFLKRKTKRYKKEKKMFQNKITKLQIILEPKIIIHQLRKTKLQTKQ